MPVDAHASLCRIGCGASCGADDDRHDRQADLHYRASPRTRRSKRLRSIPGIGLLGASAIITATVQDPKAFRSGRDFAAWIGLRCRVRIRPAASRSSGRSRSRAIKLFATHSGGRGPCGVEIPRAAEAGEVSVAHATPGATTLQDRGGSACKQDGARGLGVAGQGRHLLSGAGGSGLIGGRGDGRMKLRRWRSRTAGVMKTLMRNGRDRRSENP